MEQLLQQYGKEVGWLSTSLAALECRVLRTLRFGIVDGIDRVSGRESRCWRKRWTFKAPRCEGFAGWVGGKEGTGWVARHRQGAKVWTWWNGGGRRVVSGIEYVVAWFVADSGGGGWFGV